jgi:hypothetical protein
MEGLVRSITDILWSGSHRIRAWRGGDVRVVYYSVLAVLLGWGLFAMASPSRSSCSSSAPTWPGW